MQQITAAQFKAAIELDPAWASKLTEPVEITGYCDMESSKITHLSPLLHFVGEDEYGNSANFWNCKSLKIAEGNFIGFVSFHSAGIEKIRDLCCGTNSDGNSAYFQLCRSLKIAEGKFDEFVNFSYSAIEKIGDLTCGKDQRGDSAAFDNCKSLKVAKGKFEGAAYFHSSGIEKIGDLSCAVNEKGIRLDLRECPSLTKIPVRFTPREVRADSKLLEKLEVDRFIQKKRAEIMEIEL